MYGTFVATDKIEDHVMNQKKIERRNSERFGNQVLATYRIFQPGSTHNQAPHMKSRASVLNHSRLGINVRIKTKLNEGTVLSMRIKFKDEGDEYSYIGRVVWCDALPFEHIYQAGIEFVSAFPEAMAI